MDAFNERNRIKVRRYEETINRRNQEERSTEQRTEK